MMCVFVKKIWFIKSNRFAQYYFKIYKYVFKTISLNKIKLKKKTLTNSNIAKTKQNCRI